MEPDSLAAASSVSSSSPVPGDKVLVIKGIAGLGNRILCALGGILYARLSGRRVVIDWTDPLYSPNGDNVFHRFFTCPSCSPTATIPMTDSVAPALWRGRLHDDARRIVQERGYNADQVRRELTIDVGKLDYQEDLLVLVEYHAPVERMKPYFQGSCEEFAQMLEREILVRLLRDNLELQPEIRARVDDFKRRHFDSRTVGVHVRYSDYRVRLVAIIRRLNALLAREPKLQIFLATDNLEVKKMFERSYPRVLTTPHWYGEAGRPIHTNSGSSCTDTAIEALIDMYLLAECEHLVYDASSSFSEVASLLSRSPWHNKIDVSTGTHRKGNRRVRGIITRWMRRLRFSSWAFQVLPKLVPIRWL